MYFEASNRKFDTMTLYVMLNFVQIKTTPTFRLVKSVYYVLFDSYQNYSILTWGRANKTILLPLTSM